MVNWMEILIHLIGSQFKSDQEIDRDHEATNFELEICSETSLRNHRFLEENIFPTNRHVKGCLFFSILSQTYTENSKTKRAPQNKLKKAPAFVD